MYIDISQDTISYYMMKKKSYPPYALCRNRNGMNSHHVLLNSYVLYNILLYHLLFSLGC